MKPRLILAGAGHAHLAVLRDLAERAWPQAEVMLVCPQPLSVYSGMVPGWLAGRYAWDEINIDVATLALRAGATLIQGEIGRIEAGARRVVLQSGRELDYDRLSLNLGSDILRPEGAAGVAIRPLLAFRGHWSTLCRKAENWPRGTTRRVAVVGAGAAGIEVLLAIQSSLARAAPQVNWQWHLVSRAPEILPGWTASTQRRVVRVLAERGVHLHLSSPVVGLTGHTLLDGQGQTLGIDEVVWCPGAAAPECLAGSGLVLDARGFVGVDRCLRSVSHPEVYAAGDCAAFAEPLPKAGVYAVREGPVLARNLRASLGDGPARPYRPQRRALALLNTADGRSIGQWGRFSAEGAWLMHWKDRIDRRFVRLNTTLEPDPSPGLQGDRDA